MGWGGKVRKLLEINKKGHLEEVGFKQRPKYDRELVRSKVGEGTFPGRDWDETEPGVLEKLKFHVAGVSKGLS